MDREGKFPRLCSNRGFTPAIQILRRRYLGPHCKRVVEMVVSRNNT